MFQLQQWDYSPKEVKLEWEYSPRREKLNWSGITPQKAKNKLEWDYSPKGWDYSPRVIPLQFNFSLLGEYSHSSLTSFGE
jgi:hypothetical protein